MITLKIHIGDETCKEIKKIYGTSNYGAVETVVADILNRHLNAKHFNPKLTIAKKNYEICAVCGEKAIKNMVIDIDGTNLEEHKICQNCGAGQPKIE